MLALQPQVHRKSVYYERGQGVSSQGSVLYFLLIISIVMTELIRKYAHYGLLCKQCAPTTQVVPMGIKCAKCKYPIDGQFIRNSSSCYHLKVRLYARINKRFLKH